LTYRFIAVAQMADVISGVERIAPSMGS